MSGGAVVWEKTKSTSKKGFDKAWAALDHLGTPVNKLSNKLGAEAFWPTTLDKESDKAARILRSFCKDGFYEKKEDKEQDPQSPAKRKLKIIPRGVIARAKGLAIFTTMRTGLWISGSGGSGVLVARQSDGSWSPPSGILVHTLGLGFLAGVDIYDCVLVLNSQEALDAFTKIRATVGGELSAVAGPVGLGGILDSEVHKRQQPIFSYLKSRGLYAGVQIDGTVIIERTDENERFYCEKLRASEILAGKVRHPPVETRTLLDTIKAVQTDSDVLHSMLPSDPAPGDLEVERTDQLFGIPDSEDPDPFGVLALEKEGLEIREAGTKSRPSSEQFEYRPSPTSPIFSTFNRKSIDNFHGRNRDSYQRKSVDVGIQTEDRPVQTSDASVEVQGANSPRRVSGSPMGEDSAEARPESAQRSSVGLGLSLPRIEEPTEGSRSNEQSTREEHEAQSSNGAEGRHDEHDEPHDDLEHGQKRQDERREIKRHNIRDSLINDGPNDTGLTDDDPVLEVHAQVQAAPQVISKARLVTIPKRIPPALPPRSPARQRPVSPSHHDTSAGSASTSTPSLVIHESQPEGLANGVPADAVAGQTTGEGAITMHDDDPKAPSLLAAAAALKAGDSDDESGQPASHLPNGIGNSNGVDNARGGKDISALAPAAEEDDFHSVPTSPH